MSRKKILLPLTKRHTHRQALALSHYVFMDSRRASANPRTGDPESLCSQEVSIKIQGAYHYLRHPQQDIYLAVIYRRDVSFCRDPAKAPWEALIYKMS